MAAASPLSFWLMERVSPSHVGKGGFAPVMRLATAIGLVGGLHILYQRSCSMSIPEYTHTAHQLSVRLTISQTASTALRRIRERLDWILGRWSTKSRTVNLCTVTLKSLIIYKGWQQGTRGIRSCSSISSHGSTPLIMIRLVIPFFCCCRGSVIVCLASSLGSD